MGLSELDKKLKSGSARIVMLVVQNALDMVKAVTVIPAPCRNLPREAVIVRRSVGFFPGHYTDFGLKSLRI